MNCNLGLPYIEEQNLEETSICLEPLHLHHEVKQSLTKLSALNLKFVTQNITIF